MKLTLITLGIMMAAGNAPALSDTHLIETRYCGEPKRNAAGNIRRNSAVIRQFERLYPLPSGYARSDWQVDHVIPLSKGGCDSVSNAQWLPESIKTCVDDNCKDRWERGGIYPDKR